MTDFGPTGQLVYERTYSRTKPDGSKETWPETVRRVVDGNLSLVSESRHLHNERERLVQLMEEFKVIPAGRQLWASGVSGRQYLFNCHVSGWGVDITDHFHFTFMRLMEGGGVGANYSNRFLYQYPVIENMLRVHIVCDPSHPDYDEMSEAGILSSEYDADWPGAFEVEDSREGWADALVELLTDHYRVDLVHENRVFDVSRVRAKGSRLKTFGGTASGPQPLAVMLHETTRVMNQAEGGLLSGLEAMEIDHAIAECVVSGGNRRSARMALMHWSDPEIHDFLVCKSETGKHWTTNISVEVDDDFWDAVEDGNVRAESVLDSITVGMLNNGEPGFWDSDLSNEGEPNEVIATNPCGEIALESWENCNLGHVNLAAFVSEDGQSVYLPALLEAHSLMTRFLLRATYGDVNDEKQADKLARNRRIGVGHFGFASMLAKLGVRYSDAPRDEDVQSLLIIAAAEVEKEATRYAHDLRIPVPVKTRTVAPTGTIAKMPGVSEGIHPIFAKYFIRRIRLSTINPDEFEKATEYAAKGYKVETDQYAPNTMVVEIPTKDSLMAEVSAIYTEEDADNIVQSAAEVNLDEMLAVQAMYQEYWADNAVSFTANVDPSRYSPDEVRDVLMSFKGLLKGATVFPEISMPQAPYERLTRVQYEAFATTEVADGIDEECASGACPVK